jgi:hypothetical protein
MNELVRSWDGGAIAILGVVWKCVRMGVVDTVMEMGPTGSCGLRLEMNILKVQRIQKPTASAKTLERQVCSF